MSKRLNHLTGNGTKQNKNRQTKKNPEQTKSVDGPFGFKNPLKSV